MIERSVDESHMRDVIQVAFWGMGAEEHAVPWSKLTYHTGGYARTLQNSSLWRTGVHTGWELRLERSRPDPAHGSISARDPARQSSQGPVRKS